MKLGSESKLPVESLSFKPTKNQDYLSLRDYTQVPMNRTACQLALNAIHRESVKNVLNSLLVVDVQNSIPTHSTPIFHWCVHVETVRSLDFPRDHDLD